MEVAEKYEPSYWKLHGSHEVVALGSPAAGSALTYTLPGAVQQEPLAISFLYTCSAGVANRFPLVQFLDWSGVAFCEVQTPFKLVATNVCQVTFAVDIEQFGADSAARMGCSIPRLRLGDGLQVKITATAIAAADTITAARLFVCQYDVRPDEG